MIHQLKVESEYFESIIRGDKTFEVRKNDRDFITGDYLALNERGETPQTIESVGKEDTGIIKKFVESGRCTLVEVTYVLDNKSFCKEGFVILGFKPCWIKPMNNALPAVYTEEGLQTDV